VSSPALSEAEASYGDLPSPKRSRFGFAQAGGRVMRWERATPMAVMGCVINMKSAIGVARSQP